jgi:hypothetical protein
MMSLNMRLNGVRRSRLGLSGNTLLFFGLIRRYKGLPRLLEAMPLVLKKVDCTLLVVGEFYEGKDHCLNLINALGLASNVRIIDRFIPDGEVSLYFSAADLVVLPYESATQSAIVPIAYAFERPVLATRVGGLPEAVRDGETGLLVEPHDPNTSGSSDHPLLRRETGGPVSPEHRSTEAALVDRSGPHLGGSGEKSPITYLTWRLSLSRIIGSFIQPLQLPFSSRSHDSPKASYSIQKTRLS